MTTRSDISSSEQVPRGLFPLSPDRLRALLIMSAEGRPKTVPAEPERTADPTQAAVRRAGLLCDPSEADR